MGYTKQQLKAINCKSNCAVSAGAGSGKTKVLSARFIRLVEEGTPCNRILTITFTKKATAEMKERIHKMLAESCNADQLKLFPQAAISTVDSFCAEVAKSDCVRYGFTSDMKIAETIDLTDEFTLAAKKYIETADINVVHELADRMSIENIVKMLVLCALETNIIDGFDPEFFSEKYIEEAEKEEKRIRDLLVEETENYIDTVAGDSKLDEIVRNLQAFLDVKTTADEVEFSRAQGTGEEHKAATKHIKEVFKTNKPVYSICLNTLKDEELIKKFYSFAGEYVNRTIEYKRQTGQVDFNDVMQMSLDILENNKRIRNYFKNRFDYVMIDEFQDNNSDHRKLLYLLCEKNDALCDGVPGPENLQPGKLFLVGDDKQSIYKFRGADVSVFNRICEELKANGGEVLELGINFRSTPVLVDHFTQLFEKVMANPSADFEAKFRKLEANKSKDYPARSRILYNSFHHPRIIEKDQFEAPMATKEQSEAYSIACLIKEMTETDNWLINTEDGTAARPQYKDIAILLRTSGHQGSFEKALRLQGIPYSLAETRALMTEALVCDIYSILSFALYPHDLISKAAYLKGPLCNVSDSELKQKLEEEREEINNIPLTSSAAAVRYIWYETGYRISIISNPANQVFTEHYNWLYSLACEFDRNGKTIGQFLDYLRPLIGKTDKLKELKVFNEDPDGVQIMTIHKSKGLGFPIVIICSMESSIRDENVSEVCNKDGIIYMPFSIDGEGKPSNLMIATSREDENNRETAELKRLFYVASTRAQCHIVYSACPETGRDLSKSETLCDLFESAFPYDCESNDLIDNGTIETRNFSLIEEEKTFSKQRLENERINAVAHFYSNPSSEQFDWKSYSVAVTDTNPLQAETNGKMLPVFDWDKQIIEENLQTDFGTIVHGFIENRILGNKVNVETDIQRAASSLADNFFNSSFFNRISKMKLYPERKFTMAQENMLVEGKIDLMADDGNTVIIYDFKTDKFFNPEIHRNQLETYSKAVRTIMPDRNVEAWIIYLRDPECSVRV